MKKVLTFILLTLSLVMVTGCDRREPEEITYGDEIEEMLLQANEIDNLYSLSISMNGEILAEEYFGYRTETYNANVFSVTKSVTSILVGIAIDKGYIESVEESIGNYIDLSSYDNQEDLEEIKIKHLLTMSAGIIWDSGNLSSEMINLRGTLNALDFILEREMGFTPGTRFNYSDGSAHLVSYILEEATGMTSHEFAVEHLFTPLGIEDTYWNKDRSGTPIGGCDLYLRTLDMSIIGNLVLNDGMHEGTQIVSKEWLDVSTSNQIERIASHGYGYFWWLSSKDGYDLISARGWGGQQIYIIKELGIVITTSANGNIADQVAYEQYDEIEDFVYYNIIPIFTEEQ